MDKKVVDRQVLVAILARKLWNSAEEFTKEYEPVVKLVLGADPQVFRNYLFDLLTEACQLIKEKKGVK